VAIVEALLAAAGFVVLVRTGRRLQLAVRAAEGGEEGLVYAAARREKGRGRMG
jgi:hypothetical protein